MRLMCNFATMPMVRIEGREVRLTHLDKVLWPGTGTTKRELLEYYAAVAETFLPYSRGRLATFVRTPDGVEGQPFFQKRPPAGTPDWVTVSGRDRRSGGTDQVQVDDLATLMWAANGGCIEVHTTQSLAVAPESADRLVLDLDPGEGMTVVDCCRVALWLRARLAEDGLLCWAKTSGSKGLHLLAALRHASPKEASDYARTVAVDLQRQHPERRNRHHERALADKIAALPEPMAGQLQDWVLVMRGEGRRRHPAVDYPRIRRYLRLAWPVLSGWAADGMDLRQVTAEHITTVLDARTASSARAVHNVLNSIFRALKQQRVIFHDPMRGLSLTTPVRLPVPLPSGQLRGALDRLDRPVARLAVALVAIHGLRLVDVARLRLADVAPNHRELTVRTPAGTRVVHLDDLTGGLLSGWLRERRERWPGAANTHVITNQQTARHPASPPVSYPYLRAAFDQIGLKPRQVWADRVLYEAKQTVDPVHLTRLFGIHPGTAVK